MKNIKKILVTFLFAAFMINALTPAPVFAAGPTEAELQKVYKLLDETIELRNNNTERIWKLLDDIESCQNNKKAQQCKIIAGAGLTVMLAAFAFIPVVAVSGMSQAAVSITTATPAAGGYATYFTAHVDAEELKDSRPGFVWSRDHYSITAKRLKQYNETKEAHERDNSCTIGKVCKADDRFLSSLTKLFFDDPASALTFIEDDKSLLPRIMEKDSYALQHLENFNKILSTDPKIYSDYALKKLASAKGKAYYKNLVQYIEIKEKTAEFAGTGAADFNKILKNDYPKSKARKVVSKEHKDAEKSGSLQ